MMTDTDKINLIFEAAKLMAKMWKNFSSPVRFERVIFVDDVPVRVIVEAGDHGASTAEHSLETMNAERSSDA